MHPRLAKARGIWGCIWQAAASIGKPHPMSSRPSRSPIRRKGRRFCTTGRRHRGAGRRPNGADVPQGIGDSRKEAAAGRCRTGNDSAESGGLTLGHNPSESLKLAQAALAVFEKQLGPMDARTGAAYGTLGAALAMQGNVAEAERMFRRALAIVEKAHGPKAPETASALENLADLLAQTGRELAALPLLDRAQKIRAGSH